MIRKHSAIRASILILILITLSHEYVISKPLSQLITKSGAERFILQKIQNGLVADLNEYSQDSTDRIIRAEFLEELLTGDYDIHRHGIRIKYAEITDSIDLICAIMNNRIWLHNCHFHNFVDFKHSVSNNLLSFRNSTFHQNADFHGIKVHGSLFFDSSQFYGAADFAYSEIFGGFDLESATFHDDTIINLSSIYVKHNLDLSFAVFNGGTAFYNAIIRGDLSLSGAKLRGGDVYFSGMNVGRRVDLTYTEFDCIVHLYDMNYHEIIRSKYMDESNSMLLEFVESAEYYQGSYINLADYYKREGYQDWANKTLIAQKRRERKDYLKWSTSAYWKNLFMDKTVGYGQRPEQAFIISLIIIIIGWLTFFRSKNIMENCKNDKPFNLYSAFWFSFDAFIPFIDLKASAYWQPKKSQKWTWLYLRIHTILGWILIPVGFAAITGLIK